MSEGEAKYRRVDGGDHGGEYVTKEYADAHPDTTVREHDAAPEAAAEDVDQSSDLGVLSDNAVPNGQ